jgi:hypothetical protein
MSESNDVRRDQAQKALIATCESAFPDFIRFTFRVPGGGGIGPQIKTIIAAWEESNKRVLASYYMGNLGSIAILVGVAYPLPPGSSSTYISREDWAKSVQREVEELIRKILQTTGLFDAHLQWEACAPYTVVPK